MSIYLDETGKPSATRAVVFLLVGLLIVLAILEALWDMAVGEHAWGALKAILVTLGASIAVRATAKNVRPEYVLIEEEEDLSVDAHGVGFRVDTEYDDGDEEYPDEWV